MPKFLSTKQSSNLLEVDGQSTKSGNSLQIIDAQACGDVSELVQGILSIHSGGLGWISLSCSDEGRADIHHLKHEHLTQQDICEELMVEFDRKDLYVSACRYFGRDPLSPVTGISMIWAELKPAKHGTAKFPWQLKTTPDECASEVLAYLPGVGLGDTKPSIIWTGDGLLLIWRLEHLPGPAEPRWRALQTNIVQRLLPIGADPSQIDIRMSLRVAGSWNTACSIPEAHRRTRILVRGDAHEFDVLCEKLLPISRDELRRRRRQGTKHRLDAASLWLSRLADIQAWAMTVWPQGVPGAFRDNVIWLAAVAIAWSARDLVDVDRAINSFVRAISPFALPEEFDGCVGSVRDRLSCYVNGQRELFRFTDEALAEAITKGLGPSERNAWKAIAAGSLSSRQCRRGIKSGRARQLRRLPSQHEAKEYFATGKSYSEIGKLLKVSKSTAWRLVNGSLPIPKKG